MLSLHISHSAKHIALDRSSMADGIPAKKTKKPPTIQYSMNCLFWPQWVLQWTIVHFCSGVQPSPVYLSRGFTIINKDSDCFTRYDTGLRRQGYEWLCSEDSDTWRCCRQRWTHPSWWLHCHNQQRDIEVDHQCSGQGNPETGFTVGFWHQVQSLESSTVHYNCILVNSDWNKSVLLSKVKSSEQAPVCPTVGSMVMHLHTRWRMGFRCSITYIPQDDASRHRESAMVTLREQRPPVSSVQLSPK